MMAAAELTAEGVGRSRTQGLRRSAFDAAPLLFVANWVAYYLEISISSAAGPLFPNVVCFLIGGLSLVVCRHRIAAASAFWCFVLICLLAASALLSTVALGDDQLFKRITSALQMTAALVSALGCFFLALTIGRDRFAGLFFGCWLVLVAGSMAELAGWLRPLSDAVRAGLYRDVSIYTDVMRDQLIYGAPRPSFFGREPSLVGIHTGLAMSLWFMTTRLDGRRRVLALCGMTVISALVVRSPTLLYFVGVCALAEIFVRRRPGAGWRVTGLVAALTSIVLAPSLLWSMSGELGGALQLILQGGSFFIRQIGPPAVAMQVLGQHPFLGVGIGAYGSLDETLIDTYAALGAFAAFPELSRATAVNGLISNAFWEFWMFFGLLGGGAIVASVLALLSSLRVGAGLFVVTATALAAQNFGGAATFRLAFFLFLFAAAVHLVRHDNDNGFSRA